jgi:hypothetical protein
VKRRTYVIAQVTAVAVASVLLLAALGACRPSGPKPVPSPEPVFTVITGG